MKYAIRLRDDVKYEMLYFEVVRTNSSDNFVFVEKATYLHYGSIRSVEEFDESFKHKMEYATRIIETRINCETKKKAVMSHAQSVIESNQYTYID